MSQPYRSSESALLEEAVIILFCLIDDAYANLNPRGQRYESLKRLSDSEVITLALLQQLRGVESERSFLRDAVRFLSHLFPGMVGLHPSSLQASATITLHTIKLPNARLPATLRTARPPATPAARETFNFPLAIGLEEALI